MSDKQREVVEGLMQGLVMDDATAVSTSHMSDAGQLDSQTDDSDVRQGLTDGLIRAGFSAADSVAAVKAVGVAAGEAAAAAATAATASAAAGGRGHARVWRSHEGLQPYLDWLCLHLPVERLPARYRPGGWVTEVADKHGAGALQLATVPLPCVSLSADLNTMGCHSLLQR